MSVGKRMRYEVLRRDNFTCHYCGLKATETDGQGLEVDHVIPESLGGPNHPSNLVTACIDCNSGKSSTTPDAPLVEEVAADAERWANALAAAAQEYTEENVKPLNDAVAIFKREWGPLPLPHDWRSSVEQVIRCGLPAETIPHYVAVAKGSKAMPEYKFRYFCGCAWRVIDSIRDKASRKLQDDPTGEETQTDEEADQETRTYWFDVGVEVWAACGERETGENFVKALHHSELLSCHAAHFAEGWNTALKHDPYSPQEFLSPPIPSKA